jgi:AraC-like DNA-binding protein
MARLTSLLPRDERTGLDDEAEGLASQQARIGRLDLEFIRLDRSLTRKWGRVSNVHDASYVLAFPLAGGAAFSQDGRTGFARPGEYVLLSELAYYELSSDKNARYHLRRRIVDFIESHLSDQSLSPKKIAASSRISLSYLYSLFNDNETTVSQFVQTKRLQRAYEILVADPKGHRTVSEVAYEVGFKNVSHFSRCFSRHFKVAPRDVRQTHNASPAPNTDPRPAPTKGLIAPRVPSSSRGRLASPYWERRPLHETV